MPSPEVTHNDEASRIAPADYAATTTGEYRQVRFVFDCVHIRLIDRVPQVHVAGNQDLQPKRVMLY